MSTFGSAGQLPCIACLYLHIAQSLLKRYACCVLLAFHLQDASLTDMASEEAWRTRVGCDDARDDGGALDTNGASGGGDGDGAADYDVEVVARMSKKRQRMEQLIKKSMGMVPRTFEQEALPTQDQRHTGSTTTVPASSLAFGSAAVCGGTRACASRLAAVPTAVSDEDPDCEQLHTTARNSKHCWTPDEDAKLCALVDQHGRSQWANVAAHFPNRDRKRCRERFVNHLDPQLKQQHQEHQVAEWTEQEEAQLVELQRELGNKWAAIARRLPGRSPEDVKNRFLTRAAKQQLVALTQQSGSSQATESESARAELARAPPRRWSKVEANTLRSLVQAHGATSWFFLASHLPGRTDLQCMQQWYQVLDPAVVKGRGTWTPAEDATLLSKVQELGPKWTQVRSVNKPRLGTLRAF